MIKVMVYFGEGRAQEGGEELIAQWRASPGSYLWLDMEGEFTERAGRLLNELGCDDLAINDCFRARHPPKVEDFAHSTFILFRGISRLDNDLELEPQQIGLWVGKNFLISVHRGTSLSVQHFWEHASMVNKPNILALRLLHYACGRYLEKLLEFEDRLADMEDGLLTGRSEEEMKQLVLFRSRLRKLQRIFNYHQRMADNIWRAGSPHIGEGDDDSSHTRRDLYDRCERLHSLCSMYYEQCGDLIEGYLSLSSHKLNNTMKVLTIITAVFVPLGFLAGLYGMNFENMPELRWRYSYFFLLGFMAFVATCMMALFRRIKWL